MKLIFKNSTEKVLEIFIEPSTDELLLNSGDVLTIISKYETTLPVEQPFEVDYFPDGITVWVAHGQSADFYINGKEIETICSKEVW